MEVLITPERYLELYKNKESKDFTEGFGQLSGETLQAGLSTLQALSGLNSNPTDSSTTIQTFRLRGLEPYGL